MRRPSLEVGDRVMRQINIVSGVHYADFRRGTIVRVYTDRPGCSGHCNTLYAVRWDGETSDRIGYLEGGLQREALMVPTMWYL